MATRSVHVLDDPNTPIPECCCDDCQFLKAAHHNMDATASRYLARILWWHRGMKNITIVDANQ